MYTYESRVRYSEVDAEGLLSLSGIINYFQDCSTFHSEDSGVGVEHLSGIKRTWLLAAWQIDIKRRPKLAENIKVLTNPYDNNRFFAYRNFAMEDESGDLIVKANTTWIYVNTETGEVVSITDDSVEPFNSTGAEPGVKLDMDYQPRKIKLPKDGSGKNECESHVPIEVMAHHIDTNGHMNNSEYVRLACGFLPEDAEIKRLRVEYKSAATLGDILTPAVYREVSEKDGAASDRYVITLTDEKENICAVVEAMC